MKKLAALAIVGTFALGASAAPDIHDILGGLLGGAGANDSTATAPAGGSQGSSLIDELTGLGNALGIIPSKSVDIDYLTGTWNYQKPAVAFKSENFLAKAGGAAASAKVEKELEPYYRRLGFDKMKMTVEPDSTFTMQLGRIPVSGTISTEGSGNDTKLMFHLAVRGFSIGSMEAYVNAQSNSVMSITFNIDRLLTLANAIARFTGGAKGETISAILSQYDGLTAGFELKKAK